MDRIRELRLEAKKSMRQVATELELPYTTYVNYEKGLREPNSEILIKLANYYHVTIDYLLGHVSDPFFYLDNERILAEINDSGDGCKKAPTLSGERALGYQDIPDRNIIRIAGRNGSYEERILSDEQLSALKAIIDQMPDASDDL